MMARVAASIALFLLPPTASAYLAPMAATAQPMTRTTSALQQPRAAGRHARAPAPTMGVPKFFRAQRLATRTAPRRVMCHRARRHRCRRHLRSLACSHRAGRFASRGRRLAYRALPANQPAHLRGARRGRVCRQLLPRHEWHYPHLHSRRRHSPGRGAQRGADGGAHLRVHRAADPHRRTAQARVPGDRRRRAARQDEPAALAALPRAARGRHARGAEGAAGHQG